jgi:transposase-like protein
LSNARAAEPILEAPGEKEARTAGASGHSGPASAINQRLDASLAQFAGRPLAKASPYLILDARYKRVRESGVIASARMGT